MTTTRCGNCGFADCEDMTSACTMRVCRARDEAYRYVDEKVAKATAPLQATIATLTAERDAAVKMEAIRTRTVAGLIADVERLTEENEPNIIARNQAEARVYTLAQGAQALHVANFAALAAIETLRARLRGVNAALEPIDAFESSSDWERLTFQTMENRATLVATANYAKKADEVADV